MCSLCEWCSILYVRTEGMNCFSTMRALVLATCALLCAPVLCPAARVSYAGYLPEEDQLDPLDVLRPAPVEFLCKLPSPISSEGKCLRKQNKKHVFFKHRVDDSPEHSPCPTERLLQTRTTCVSNDGGVIHSIPCIRVHCCDTHVLISGRCVPKSADPCSLGVCEQACEIRGNRVWCTCHSGYVFHEDNFKAQHQPYCVDVDECANQNGGCSQRCVNDPGGFHCECDYPTTLVDGYRCEGAKPMLTPEPLPLIRMATQHACYAPCDTVSWLSKEVKQLSDQLHSTHSVLKKLMENPLLKEGGDHFAEGTSIYRVLDSTAPLEGGHCRCERGPRGPPGAPGMEGPKGDQGARGPRGARGPKGSLDLMLLLLADIRHDITNLEARVYMEGEQPERFNLKKAWRHQRKQEKLVAESQTEPLLEAYTSPPTSTSDYDVTDDDVEISPNGAIGEIPHSPSTAYQDLIRRSEPPDTTLAVPDALLQLRELANDTGDDKGAEDDDDEDIDDHEYNFY